MASFGVFEVNKKDDLIVIETEFKGNPNTTKTIRIFVNGELADSFSETSGTIHTVQTWSLNYEDYPIVVNGTYDGKPTSTITYDIYIKGVLVKQYSWTGSYGYTQDRLFIILGNTLMTVSNGLVVSE